jgi:hypothetical protein
LLEVGQMGNATYNIEGGETVWYRDFEGTQVFMQLIPTFSSYEYEDELPVIAGKDGVMFEACVNRLVDNIPHDNHNDAN